MSSLAERTVSVPFERLPGWVRRYDERHPDTIWTVTSESVAAESPDGSGCRFAIPYAPLGARPTTLQGPAEPGPATSIRLEAVYSHLTSPWRTGVLLVRRGGFAVALLVGAEVVASKVGQRHVQGRTKAGGWSQQRFARRRDNQAREAFEAAAGHLAAVVVPHADNLVTLGIGGDRTAVDSVLSQKTSAPLEAVPRCWLGAYPDPKRATLDAAVTQLRSVVVTLVDPP